MLTPRGGFELPNRKLGKRFLHLYNDRMKWLGFIFIFGLCLFLLTFIPLYTRIQRTDQTRIDILLHRSFREDYQSFLSVITQGQNGSFFSTNPFVTDHQRPVPLFAVFTIAGLLSRPFNLWPPYVYHLLRGLGAALVILSVYLFMKEILRSARWASVGAFVALIVANPPEFLFRQDIARSFMPWWDYLSAYERINELPHHLFAQAFLMLAVMYYFRYLRSSRRIHLFISTFFISLSIYTVPHTVFPYFCIVVAGELPRIITIIKTNRHILPRYLVTYLACIALPGFSLVHMSLATNDPLWQANKIWEVNFWKGDPWAYYHGYLTTLFLIIPSIACFLAALKRHRISPALLLGVWTLSPLVAYPFLTRLGVGTGRMFLQSYIIIPMSAMSVIAIRNVVNRSPARKIIVSILCILLVLWGAYDTLQHISSQSNYVASEPISDVYYIPKTIYETAVFVKQSIAPKSNLLADNWIGSVIVSFAPVYTYIGKQTHGTNWDIDTSEINAFLSQQLPVDKASQWIHAHHIQYVMFDTLWYQSQDLTYPFLKLIWKNDRIHLYKIV